MAPKKKDPAAPPKPPKRKKPAPGNLIQEAIAHAPGSTAPHTPPASKVTVSPKLSIDKADRPVLSLSQIGRGLKKVYETGQKPKKPAAKDPTTKGAAPFRPAQPFAGLDPITGKKWSAITGANLANQRGTVVDYVAHPVTEPGPFGLSGALAPKQPKKITNKEYDALRKAASKGNVKAQQILDRERYKAVGYPSPAKDIQKVLQPYTKAIQQQLPADAAALQSIANQAVAQSSYAAQLPSINQDLAQMNIGGVTAMPAPTPETQSYMNQIQGVMSSLPTFATQTLPGIPSMDQAIADMGKAATISNKAVASEDIINALLQHQQTEIVYGTNSSNALAGYPLSDFPTYVQNLIASVGNTSGVSSALLGALPGQTNTNAQVPAATNPSTTPGVPG